MIIPKKQMTKYFSHLKVNRIIQIGQIIIQIICQNNLNIKLYKIRKFLSYLYNKWKYTKTKHMLYLELIKYLY